MIVVVGRSTLQKHLPTYQYRNRMGGGGGRWYSYSTAVLFRSDSASSGLKILIPQTPESAGNRRKIYFRLPPPPPRPLKKTKANFLEVLLLVLNNTKTRFLYELQSTLLRELLRFLFPFFGPNCLCPPPPSFFTQF